ncbi:MAG: tetratricopeptide repeat protein [Thermodesulfobacteriota bacterium]
MAVLCIILCGFAAYSNTFTVPLLLDDSLNLLENPSIKSVFPLGKTLAGSPRTGISGRPVSNLSFALSWALSGPKPWGHHAVNLAIHILCGLALFFIMLRALALPAFSPAFGGKILFPAFACAWIWTLHPLDIQAVTYITQRIESLMALFFLCCFLFALKGFAAGKRAGWHLASVACFFLGAGTKEVIVAAPFLILLFDALFISGSLRRALTGSKVLYAGFAAGICFLAFMVSRGQTAELAYAGTEKFSAWQYASFQPIVLCLYLARSFWPSGLCFDYGWPSDGTFGWPLPAAGLFFPAALLILVLLGLTLYGLFRRNGLSFGWAWFFAVLTPTSSVLPLYCLAAEQRMYLPLTGVVCSAVPGAFLAGRALVRRAGLEGKAAARARVAGAFLVIALGLALLTASHARNRMFSSEASLWADTLEKLPRNSRAATNLGKVLFYQGRGGEAIAMFEKALAVRPDLMVARRDLGLALVDAGRIREGIEQTEKALAILPENADNLYAVGFAWMAAGDPQKAVSFLSKAVERKPGHAQAQVELGSALVLTRDFPGAEAHLRAALDADPSLASAHVNLGLLYLALNKRDQALGHLTRAVSLAPGYLQARLSLGRALFELRRTTEAADQYSAALRIASDSTEALSRMGEILALQGRYQQALEYFDKSLGLSFDARTSANAGTALLRMGRPDRARAYFRKALEAEPDYGRGWFNLGLALAQCGDSSGARVAMEKARTFAPELFAGAGKGDR